MSIHYYHIIIVINENNIGHFTVIIYVQVLSVRSKSHYLSVVLWRWPGRYSAIR